MHAQVEPCSFNCRNAAVAMQIYAARGLYMFSPGRTRGFRNRWKTIDK